MDNIVDTAGLLRSMAGERWAEVYEHRGVFLEIADELDALKARLAEYEAKDGQRTREHNILVRENREQGARLAEMELSNGRLREGRTAAEARLAEAERNYNAEIYRTLDWERWAREVLTDFRVPFDNHTVGLRLGIVQLIHDMRNSATPLPETAAHGGRPMTLRECMEAEEGDGAK